MLLLPYNFHSIFNKNMNEKTPDPKQAPWYQSFKGVHLILISLGCLVVFFITQWAIFDWAFLIGLIVGIVQVVKERKTKKQ